MKFYRPKSFPILLLAGFVFVALPLLAGIVSAGYFINSLADLSTQAVFRSVDSTRASRLLLENLLAQERQARLYDVLAEPDHLAGVKEKHEEIQETIRILERFPYSDEDALAIRELQRQENELFQRLTDQSEDPEARKEILDSYTPLNILGRQIQTASHKLMVQEAENLQKESHRFVKIMFLQGSILFVASLIIITIFAYLLIRPIRQIDKGILRLGEGDFVTPVQVSGPQDLEFLGTKLDWLRERLAELEKEKNKFVAHVSHELKTPLASIREGTGLLSEEVVGPLSPQQKEVVKILSNNSRLLQKLIENIVNFNMAQARDLPLKMSAFPIDKLITEVTEDHKPILLANNLRTELDLDPVTVNGDRDQIRTVIDNLLSNAIKHSPSGSPIHLSSKKSADKLIVDIVDSGPGVPEDEKSQIFRPFFQGKASQKGRVKGTGLGLAIAREYMANHHGTIELVADDTPGAHFRLILPLREAT